MGVAVETNQGLEERLDRLESLEAIRALKHRYCRACDNNYDGPAIAACYVDNGVFDAGDRGGATGRAAIEEYFANIDSEIPAAAHVVMNEEITLRGDEADGHWWLVMPCVRIVDGTRSAHWYLAEYYDTYRRVDGQWLIASLRVRTHYFGPADGDWSGPWLASTATEFEHLVRP